MVELDLYRARNLPTLIPSPPGSEVGRALYESRDLSADPGTQRGGLS